MGRITASRKQLVGDPKHGSLLASKFINVLMWDGKKSTAQQVFYRALDRIGKQIKDAGLGKVVFAWAGGFEKNEPHYYRVQGPTFILEYDNTQNNANHVHCVWRDFQNDFGEDLLRKHHQEQPHP